MACYRRPRRHEFCGRSRMQRHGGVEIGQYDSRRRDRWRHRQLGFIQAVWRAAQSEAPLIWLRRSQPFYRR
jgi:hypothetical protein